MNTKLMVPVGLAGVIGIGSIIALGARDDRQAPDAFAGSSKDDGPPHSPAREHRSTTGNSRIATPKGPWVDGADLPPTIARGDRTPNTRPHEVAKLAATMFRHADLVGTDQRVDRRDWGRAVSSMDVNVQADVKVVRDNAGRSASRHDVERWISSFDTGGVPGTLDRSEMRRFNAVLDASRAAHIPQLTRPPLEPR